MWQSQLLTAVSCLLLIKLLFFQLANRQDGCLKLILHPENSHLHNAKDGVGGRQSAIYLAAEDVLLLLFEMPYSIFIHASCVCILWVLQFSQVNWKL